MFDLMLDAIAAESVRAYPNEERLENMIAQYYKLRWGKIVSEPRRLEQYHVQPNDEGLLIVGHIPIIRRLEIDIVIELAIFLLPLGIGLLLFWLAIADLMRLQLDISLPPMPEVYAQNEEAILGLALFIIGSMFWVLSITTLIQIGQLVL